MSIIMLGSQPTAPSAAATDRPEVSIRELLDHIAVELAHEYVRLMEGAAEAESNHEKAEPGEN